MLRSKLSFLSIIALMATSACQKYDPPPEATLIQPEGGAFVVGTPVDVTFSEAVKTNSLKIRVWPDKRNKEGLFDDDIEPLVESCSPGACGDKLKATLSDDGMSGSSGAALLRLLP